MKTALIIYNNPWILSQSIYVIKKLKITDFDIVVNENYTHNKKQFLQSEKWLKEHTDYSILSLENLGKDYDYIIRPTPTKDDGLWFLYEQFKDSEFLFIEEGMDLYQNFNIDKLIGKEKDIFTKSNLFLSHPEKLWYWTKMPIQEVINQLDIWFKEELQWLPKTIDAIVYTEPDNGKDYKGKIEELLKRYSSILLKKHPRDDTSYTHDTNVIEVPRALPGQLLFYKYPKALFILTWTSTLELYEPKDLNIKKLYF